ncbi:hypothetical protein U0070_011738, partial [Myodes glareolus]
DDRGRVIEEAKKWELKFADAIQTKEEIRVKEENCMALKDQLQQVTTCAEELKIRIAKRRLQQQHNKEIQTLENLLSQKEEENVALEEENKKAVEKTSQLMETLGSIKKESLEQKTQLQSFVKSMSSPQGDRDRILSDSQQLEERHLSLIVEKDQLIQEAAAENNKFEG